MEIFKRYHFDAAHCLRLPKNHKCNNVHGHRFFVTVHIEGDVQADGMVCDFAILDNSWKYLNDRLDHSLLNSTLDNPTCERLAEYIAHHFLMAFPIATKHTKKDPSMRRGELLKVIVQENENSGVIYYPK